MDFNNHFIIFKNEQQVETVRFIPFNKYYKEIEGINYILDIKTLEIIEIGKTKYNMGDFTKFFFNAEILDIEETIKKRQLTIVSQEKEKGKE